MLRISARAGITGGHLAALDLSRLTRVILPFDSAEEADALRQSFGPVLAEQGFAEQAEAAGSGSLRYDRLVADNG